MLFFLSIPGGSLGDLSSWESFFDGMEGSTSIIPRGRPLFYSRCRPTPLPVAISLRYIRTGPSSGIIDFVFFSGTSSLSVSVVSAYSRPLLMERVGHDFFLRFFFSGSLLSEARS